MHLQTVSDCIHIFAAAGHFNYLKSAFYYVQEMLHIEDRLPELFRRFQEGHHVIRRSNRFWAGQSTYLVVKQCLMRSLKTSGGLTRGSGMSEGQRALWTLSTPVTSEYNHVMQEFNLQKIYRNLKPFSPFAHYQSLRNIVNGVVDEPDDNVHDFRSVGVAIISKMIGQPVFSVSFQRKYKAKSLASNVSVKVAHDRTIYPGLLFQRFLVMSKTVDMSLSPFPDALFESRKIFRKPDKPELALPFFKM